jgi:hypothetical protein
MSCIEAFSLAITFWAYISEPSLSNSLWATAYTSLLHRIASVSWIYWSLGQSETFLDLWEPKVHCLVHKSHKLNFNPSHKNPVHTLTYCFLKIHLSHHPSIYIWLSYVFASRQVIRPKLLLICHSCYIYQL